MMATKPTTGDKAEPVVDVPRRAGLRTGWTTGTCASAGAKAAVLGLLGDRLPAAVTVALPSGRRVSFPVEAGPDDGAVVVKDAGDDPDCTHGARITATASLFGGSAPLAGVDETKSGRSIDLRAGSGVGTVTRPGLGLPVGAPAINAVPRRMILAAVAEAFADLTQPSLPDLVVTLSVPGGEDMATHTTNARLGIVGGISILGTTGIVRPFSTAAWRASVVQQIDVAAATGHRTVVLATGSRSEKAAMKLCPHLPEVCFVEVGDFTGIALRRAAVDSVGHIVFVGMAGKIAKLAAGVMMTHFHRSSVDGDLMAMVARNAGAPEEVVAAATETATARHFFEACLAHGTLEPLVDLCRRARQACMDHVGGALDVEVAMVDFDGESVVARA